MEKIKYTLMTNSASESRMAQLDVKGKFSGIVASVQTLSDKQVISVNQYLPTEECSDSNILQLFQSPGQAHQSKLSK